MRTVTTAAELRSELAGARTAGSRIGLVPTMGAFHDGHLSLMRQARAECDVVVVSLFVNPAQFDDPRDLTAYPRDEQRDAELAADTGVDWLFTPSASEIYPDAFATTVSVAGVSEVLEGHHRGRSHFEGVTTVVAKLFNIVAPDVAYFGQKDAQQALVIGRMVADLAFPLEIRVAPIVREPDGLALSSRNVRLSHAERERASALHRALEAVRSAAAAGEQDPAAAREHALAELDAAGVTVEYLELVDPEALTPIPRLDREVLALVAARVGATRLIDNELIQPPPVARTTVEAVNDPALARVTQNGRP